MGNLLSRSDNGREPVVKVGEINRPNVSVNRTSTAQRLVFEQTRKAILAADARITELRITNAVDQEIFDQFEYVTTVRDTTPDESAQYSANLDDEASCRRAANSFKKKFNKSGKLDAKAVGIIYECSNETCKDRVEKPAIQLEIFKTTDERGWGLKTLSEISRGTFVMQYTGDLIRCDDINESHNEKCYYYDLDHDGVTFTIDGTTRGNLTRFLNHSCEPNLKVWPVAYPNDDLRKHRLYFFAMKRIPAGSELTLDYFGGVNKKAAEKMVEGLNRKACKCGANKCRGFTF